MLVFDANADVWSHVQCMSVSDSFTSSRACCNCQDGNWCPYGRWWHVPDDVYCNDNRGDSTNVSCTSDTCRQLAAGCGVSLYDISGQANGGNGDWFIGRWGNTDWSEHGCDPQEIADGRCEVCTQPYWCDDDGDKSTRFGLKGTITTPEQWMEEFFDRDGGPALGARQCKWKNSQTRAFVDTIRARIQRRPTLQDPNNDHANPWNEVNMYVDPEGVLAQKLFDNLLGLMYVRTYGNDYEYNKMQELAAHWRDLGHDVPMFAMGAEDCDIFSIRAWDPNQAVNLTLPPYSLAQVAPGDPWPGQPWLVGTS